MPEQLDRHDPTQPRSFWEHHIEQWRNSRLSQLAYCRKHQLKPHRFYYWRRRILRPQTEVSFLPVALPADPARQPQLVRILMPNGYALELEGTAETEHVARLLTVVAAL